MLGISHIIIVFLVALLVLGPEKLPEVARTLGRILAEFRKASTDFRRVLEDEFYEIERQAKERQQQQAAKPTLELVEPVGSSDPALSAAPPEAPTAPAGTVASPGPTADRREGSSESHADSPSESDVH